MWMPTGRSALPFSHAKPIDNARHARVRRAGRGGVSVLTLTQKVRRERASHPAKVPTGKTMPRTKSVPLRGGRLARTRQPTTPGWEFSRCWWCGEGAATWEAAGGLSIEGFATGSGRLSRGCTQAFSYNAAPTPGDADDEALRELSAAFPLPPGRAALSCTGPPAAKPSPNPGSIQVRPNAD